LCPFCIDVLDVDLPRYIISKGVYAPTEQHIHDDATGVEINGFRVIGALEQQLWGHEYAGSTSLVQYLTGIGETMTETEISYLNG
jgi:hypothetical protein